MCLNPIRIKNPKLNWTENDPKYIKVPCGHCSECRAKKQQDWFIRGTYEYLQLRETGGNVFAGCLTYANEHLPHFVDKRNWQYKTLPSGKIVKVKADINFEFDGFDQEALTKFMKRFRMRYQRKYHFNPEGLKFFIACEYGEHTKRPHYHILVYIPIASIYDGEFLDLVDNTWDFGFVSKDKKQTWKIKSLSAIQYATKYVSKDLYYDNKYIQEYLDKEYLDEAEYNYRYQLVKNYLPKFRTSNNFGTKLADDILDKKNPLEYLLRDKPIEFPNRKGENKKYSIPRYILDKVVKYKDEEISEKLGRPFFRYNDLGKAYLSNRFKNFLDKKLIEFKDYENVEWIDTVLKGRCPEESYIKDNIRTILSKLDSQRFILYRNFLRYLPVGQFSDSHSNWKVDDIFDHSEELIRQFFEENCPFELYAQIRENDEKMEKYGYNPNAEVGTSLNDIESDEFKSLQTFSDQRQFRDYEKACQMVDRFDYYVGLSRKDVREHKDNHINEVRAAFSQYEEYGRHII